jgi:thioester reductase-like protein
MKSVLFTGFPGFIGMRLLPKLLRLGEGSRIVCLVQPKFRDAAVAALDTLHTRHPHTRGRIDLVAGDITEPGLGIEPGARTALRRTLWQAFHLAAVYDLAVPRELARRVNVDGTRHVLEFLGEAKQLDRLQYVSTAYVSGTARGVFRETDLDVGQGFKNHYEETKFLAEVEVVRSRLPATVYRPGVVVGDSKTGETGKFDGPYAVLRMMERLPSPGVFPVLGTGAFTVNIVPVDFVVEAMARLSATPSSLGLTYHLCDPSPRSPSELAAMFAAAAGKRFLFVPVPPAMARAAFAPSLVQEFFGLQREALAYFHDAVRHDTAQATRDLAALGVECPPLSAYLPKLVEFYRTHKDGVRSKAMV